MTISDAVKAAREHADASTDAADHALAHAQRSALGRLG
jgi:hypothetical protein